MSFPLPAMIRCLHPEKSGTDMHRRGAVCSFCFADALVPVEAKAAVREKPMSTVEKWRKERPGAVLEQAVEGLLVSLGLVRDVDYARQYAYGVDAGRSWAADFCLFKPHALLECNGQVHAIKGNREADSLKWSYAAAHGWRVLHFTKRMVEGGEARDLLTLILKEPPK